VVFYASFSRPSLPVNKNRYIRKPQ
jgi:hypothetical protein